MPFALDAVRGDAELANGRDFIIEPNLDDCEGCHVVIEENREAFHSDHKVSPIFAEMQSDFAWAENVDALLKKGRTDKTTMEHQQQDPLDFLEETTKPEAQMADFGLSRRYTIRVVATA